MTEQLDIAMDDEKSLPEYFRTSTTDDGSRGNPFYWEQIKWCRNERAKLLGLYAPKKVAATNIAGDEEAKNRLPQYIRLETILH